MEIILSNKLILILIALVILYFLSKLLLPKSLHARNRSKSKKMSKKLSGFSGEFKEPSILNYLRKIDPFVFEEILLDSFEKEGYKVSRNSRYTNDGGIDGTIYTKEGEKIIIQAKRYSNHICLQDVKDFAITIKKQNAKMGYFIHTGKTGKGVNTTITNEPITVISGSKLINLIIKNNSINKPGAITL